MAAQWAAEEALRELASDDTPLREAGITPRPATAFIRQSAASIH